MSKRKRSGAERVKRAQERITARLGPIASKLIADPLRVQIIATAHQRKLSAKEFADEWDIPEDAAAYRMRILREGGFLRVVGEEPRRGATEVYYRSTKRAFIGDADWSSLGPLVQAGISKAVVEDLYVAILNAAEAQTLDSRGNRVLWWQEIIVTEELWPRAIGVIQWALKELLELGEESAGELASGEKGVAVPAVFALLAFEAAPEKSRKSNPRKRPGKRKGTGGSKR